MTDPTGFESCGTNCSVTYYNGWGANGEQSSGNVGHSIVSAMTSLFSMFSSAKMGDNTNAVATSSASSASTSTSTSAGGQGGCEAGLACVTITAKKASPIFYVPNFAGANKPWAFKDTPLYHMGLAYGGVAAYAKGQFSNNQSLINAAADGLDKTKAQNTEALAILAGGLGARATSGSKAAKDVAGGSEKDTIVLGEDMAGRVIPTAESRGASVYNPPEAPPEQWMQNNKDWINQKMDEGCTILDCGAAPGRANYPDATSPYYKMELEQIKLRDYPNYQKIRAVGE